MSDDSGEQQINGAYTIGAILRGAREASGESIEDVSRILRINWRYLQALEEGQFENLPGSAYAIGFIKTYAAHLGIDSTDLIDQYKALGESARSKTSLEFPEPIPETGLPGGAILFAGIIVAVLAYGGWYLATEEDSFLAEMVSPVPEHLAETTDEDSEESASMEEAAVPQPTVVEEAEAEPEAEPVSETTEAVEEAAEVVEEAAEVVDDAAEEIAVVAEEAAETVEEVVEETVEAVSDSEAPVEEADVESASVAVTENAEVVSESAEAVAEETVQEAAQEIAEETPEAVEVVEETAEQTPEEEVEQVAEQVVEDAADESTEAAISTETQEEAEADVAAEADQAAQSDDDEAARELNEAQLKALQESMSEDDTVSTEAAEQVVEEVAETPEPEAETEPEPEPEVASEQVAETETTEADSTESEEQVAATSSDTLEADTSAGRVFGDEGAARIVVRAKTNSWIQVRDDSTGQLLLTRMLRTGDEYHVPDRSGLSLLTGNAGALEILVDGTTVPAIGGTGDVRRDVALDADRLLAGDAATE